MDILASLKIGTWVLEMDLRRSLAVRYYKNKRLSLGKSAKLAETNRLDFMDCLATEGAVVFDYNESDLQEELRLREVIWKIQFIEKLKFVELSPKKSRVLFLGSHTC
ncbi:MAG: hypothetical protein CO171_06810 [Syntrophobacterales bacterium CG_4_9_14_3_um_filter_49_8]|nr:MAG: hypothetical protein COX52_09480 [Syntrophobacterales bacterium CG23_combo_of_CG06-09_8_20_14_all_48_27]PJA48667.1 MAG: hypothetical protein CO171_06810 [Syntrophobacterales bacterium CG_4_9_14_3_um_filter_49_8]